MAETVQQGVKELPSAPAPVLLALLRAGLCQAADLTQWIACWVQDGGWSPCSAVKLSVDLCSTQPEKYTQEVPFHCVFILSVAASILHYFPLITPLSQIA